MRVAMTALASVLALSGPPAPGQELDIPIRGWEAPRFYQPPVAGEARRSPRTPEASALRTPPAEPDVVSAAPLTFIAVTPCRVLDTRGLNPPTPAYGAPALSHLVVREFQVGGSCGIPAGAAAVAVNATVTGTSGAGYLALWDGGGAAYPGNSTMNWTSAASTLANAAVVPLSSNGRISARAYVASSGTTDLILDVNGYYAADPMSGPFVRYGVISSLSIPSGTWTVVDYSTPIAASSDAAGLVTTGPNWRFRAPKAGVYAVAASLGFWELSWPNDTPAALGVAVGGATVPFGQRTIRGGYNEWVLLDGSTEVVLAADDQIYIQVYQRSGLPRTAINQPNSSCWVTIRFARPWP